MIINDVIQKYVFTITDNQITQSFYTTDQMGPADAIPVYIMRNGEKILAKHPNMSVRTGQTISFIPTNESTKSKFNAGEVIIHTDAWWTGTWPEKASGDYEYPFCSATTLNSGNSYTFDQPGTFHFILCSNCDNVNESTVTVHVK